MNNILIIILILASVYDLKYRIIPNYISLLVLLIGFLYGEIYFSGILISILILAICLFYQENYKGGGDIKLLGALGLVLGFYPISFIFILSDLLVIIFRKINKKIGKEILELPYAPFILISMISLHIF